MPKIHVLSVKQPEADEIVHGSRWCINRSWTNSVGIKLWIHASGVSEEASDDEQGRAPGDRRTGLILGCVDLLSWTRPNKLELVKNFLQNVDGEEPLYGRLKTFAEMLRGVSDKSWEQVRGPKCWIVTNPRLLADPIPARPGLRIWTLNVDPARLRLLPVKQGDTALRTNGDLLGLSEREEEPPVREPEARLPSATVKRRNGDRTKRKNVREQRILKRVAHNWKLDSKELPATHPGYIRPDELYTPREIFLRLKIGADGLRKAEREGLQSLVFGRCKYVLGADLIRHIVAVGRQSNA